MTPFLLSVHQASNSCLERPLCIIPGLAMMTHGPTSSNWSMFWSQRSMWRHVTVMWLLTAQPLHCAHHVTIVWLSWLWLSCDHCDCDHCVTIMWLLWFMCPSCDYCDVMWLSCTIVWLSCDYHVTIVWLLWLSCDHRDCHVTIMWPLCDCHVPIMWHCVTVMCPSCDIVWLSCDNHVTYLEIWNVFEDKRVWDGNLPANSLIHGSNVRLINGHALLGEGRSIVDRNIV